jgi:C4-dicarboxylate-specific signal transduction histidine kinase
MAEYFGCKRNRYVAARLDILLSDLFEAQCPDATRRIAHVFRYAQIGKCISSVTHQLNNSLGGIMAYAELIRQEIPLTDSASRMIDEILAAVKKSSELVNCVSTMGRKEWSSPNVVDLAQLVKQAVDLQHYDLRSTSMRLETRPDNGLPQMLVYPNQIKVALICLLTNALEEVNGRADNGMRRIRIRAVNEPDAVEIEVWNAGPPVPEDLREAVFEPFFTTKNGDHLGLGLSTAQEIARAHDGDLYYDADRGFVLHLPKLNRLRERGRLI